MVKVIIIILIFGIIFWIFQKLWPLLLLIAIGLVAYIISLFIRKNKYFKSDAFLQHKKENEETIKEFNEMAEYVKNIPNETQFIPNESYGENAHLAKFENTSKYNYKRDKNTKTLNAKNVVEVSLPVVRKASEEPIKYLCKYFNIHATEEDLNQLETIDQNISRIENAVDNLKARFERIKDDFNPPQFILDFFKEELMEKIDTKVPEINIEYTEYIFEYVSAGGNSSQRTTITFNSETIEKTEQYLMEKIKYKKSAKAQRSLMTNKLRQQIKERDDYTCQNCGASTKDQDLLLLEIDHIIPVSKGGLTTPDNLQTLCWKCNRSKSNKLVDES